MVFPNREAVTILLSRSGLSLRSLSTPTPLSPRTAISSSSSSFFSSSSFVPGRYFIIILISSPSHPSPPPPPPPPSSVLLLLSPPPPLPSLHHIVSSGFSGTAFFLRMRRRLFSRSFSMVRVKLAVVSHLYYSLFLSFPSYPPPFVFLFHP